MLFRLVALSLGLLFVAACSGAGASPPPSAGARGSAAPSASTPGGTSAPASAGATEIDLAFIDMMVPHHESAVEMAEIAAERAEHEELRAMADEIISAQQGEIDQLKTWRMEWFDSEETPPMDAMPLMPGMEMPGMGHDMEGGTMDMTADIEMLRTAEPFDRVFLETMMEHHQSAIEASQIALAESERPEITNLAEQIVSSQQAEIDQMEAWLEEWYPET